jgi:SAM-dependent methyltransferase
MSEITHGLRRSLSRPAVYSGLQRALGARDAWKVIVDSYLRPRAGERVLDLGCGPAAILDLLPEVDYTGVDLNPRYIEMARRRHGDRASFITGDVRILKLPPADFDAVLAIGMLHHLTDAEAAGVASRVAALLRPHGRLVALDPALASGQSGLARWLIDRDRGRAVRDRDGYAALLRGAFAEVEVSIRHDLARVPYSHAVTVASQPRSA